MKPNRTQLIALAGLLVSGCEEKNLEKAHQRCINRCLSSYSSSEEDQKQKNWCVENSLTYQQESCLSTFEGAIACPEGQVTPKVSCENGTPVNGSDVPSVNPSQGTSPELKSANFVVVKVDLTTKNKYMGWVGRVQTAYPYFSKSIQSLKTAASTSAYGVSFQYFADLLAEKDGIIEYPYGPSYGRAQINNITDEWYSLPGNKSHPTNKDLCGRDIKIYGGNALKFEPDSRNLGDAVLVDDADWAASIYSDDPSVLSYDDFYTQNSRKPAQINVFLFDSEYQYLFKDPELSDVCDDNPVDADVISEWKSSQYVQLKNMAASLGVPQNNRNAEAIQVRGTNTFSIAMYGNVLTQVASLPSQCGLTDFEKERMIFSTVLSHEVGHHFLSIGHDPNETQMMYKNGNCQTDQAFGYSPAYSTDPSGNEVVCPQGMECKDPNGYVVNGLRETVFYGSTAHWIP